MTIRAGTVYLVGCGPGDPGLITRRGLELLRRADVVVHDRLIAHALLNEVRPGAEVIDAGKAPGDHKMSQDEINEALVEHALAGRMVVRLKGGDPFVFGRGSEESDACAARGVACEVVPGVTSAIGAAALAGIPVTARGIARHFAVVTGQTGSGAELSDAEWAGLGKVDTLVVLMGVARVGQIARGLLAAGREPDTPVAIVERGGMPGQRRIDATLATVAGVAEARDVQNPAVIIVGEVASMGRDAGGRLAGRRILVTRPRSASMELLTQLTRMGADVIDCPLIEIEPVLPEPGWDADLSSFDVIAFTSRHGVRGFMRALAASGRDLRALARARFAAVGPTTAAELRAHHATPDIVPDEHRACGLAGAIERLAEGRRLRVLFACGTLAREELPERLRASGHRVDEAVVYQTRLLDIAARERARIEEGIDAVLLASPSAARALAASGVALGRALVGCIGPSTATTAQREGLEVAFTSHEHSDRGLVESLVAQVDAQEKHA